MSKTALSDVALEQLRGLEPRSLDGSGNNADNPRWGATGDLLIRVENAYPDGEGDDLDAIRTEPAPTEITETVMNADDGGVQGGAPVNVFNAFGVNEFTQFFGQFIAHDVVFSAGGEDDVDGQLNGITRNAGETVDGVRRQINEETSFLDLGHVYDNDPERAPLLRDPESGRMLIDDAGLPPSSDDIAHAHGVEVGEGRPIAESPVVTGDFRAAQTEQLLTHHTIWLANHNHHADRLAAQFPHWHDAEVFAAARALNEAEFQWVVYNEYLPAIIGAENVVDYDGYAPEVDPGVINDFTAAVFRFGHDQANNVFDLLEEDGGVSPSGPGADDSGADVTLSNSFIPLSGEGAGLARATTLDEQADWIRGQLGIPTQAIDGFVVSGNRGNLFGIPGLNLVAFDLVRGRDHGVNDYDGFREAHGLEPYASWDAFFTDNGIGEVRQGHLLDLYGDAPDDIANMDTVVGVLLEDEVDGSQLGPTATTVIREQFANLRDGDRLYFENRFTPDLVEAIKQTSLADIIERTTAVEHVYRDALIAAPRIGGSDDGDHLTGTDDGDLLLGFAGRDRLRGDAGDDDLYGGADADVLVGRAGDDHLYGEGGRDALWGGAGADGLYGGAGDDTMFGGGGADRFVYGEGHDVVLDFTFGVDTLILAGAFEAAPRTLRQREDFQALVTDEVAEFATGFGSTFDFGDGDRLTLLGAGDLFA